MKLIFTILILIFSFSWIFGQDGSDKRCGEPVIHQASYRSTDTVPDFTITTTDGVTRNLYSTLDSGKTVFLDLFYTTCQFCQLYAPVIEEVYQNSDEGQGNIEFWGISNNLFDPDSVIDQYKLDYNVTNPCAGPNGGGIQAFTIIVTGHDFAGFPTYCVVCPDHTMIFDACYPPNVTCFDPAFEQCGAFVGLDENNTELPGTGIISIYPNPASSELYMEIRLKEAGTVELQFINSLGTKIHSDLYQLQSGIQTISYSVGSIPPGLYAVNLVQNHEVLSIQKALIYR